MSDDELAKILERLDKLETAHHRNKSRFKSVLGLLSFCVVSFGAPIVEASWDGKGLQFKREPTSAHWVIIGGIVAASLALDGNASGLLDKVLSIVSSTKSNNSDKN